MSTITTERLTKILSETQEVISECSARGVHGSVEVNARLFENVLMELLQHRAAMLQGADGKSPVIPDGWVIVPAEPTAEMLQSGISAHYERNQIQIHDRPAPGPMECAYVAMLAAAPQQEVKA
ncbi:hypothetical protein [Enterobacter cloacae]|uniref:hypothetical protein n=1 Tax=Enterobacter cloacae TaxID=550 RepID=UPI003314B77C